MLIDCDTCTARGTGCADCVVTVLLGAPPGWQGVDPVVVPMTGRARAAVPDGDLGRRPTPRRRTSSSRRRAWWWSSTRSSAGPSGRSPTSVSCLRCGIAGRPEAAPERSSDRLSRADGPVRFRSHSDNDAPR